MRALSCCLLLSLLACSGPPGTGNTGGGSGGGSGGGGIAAGGGSGGGSAGDPTWYRDVLPIAQEHCQGCHLAGGIAPFELETYASAKLHHTEVNAAVLVRKMPPWMPAEGCGDFRDNRRLTQAAIDTISAWSAAGAPEGSPADAPPARDAGTGLSAPDATLTPMGAAYTPDATISDDYRCFVVDPGLTQDRDVIAYEIQPGQRQLVHHVLLYTAARAAAIAKDQGAPGEGWTCFGAPGVGNPPGLLGGWAPGGGAVRYPSGTGIQLRAGDVIAMQVHYNTLAGAVGPDVTKVKLQYATGAVARARLVPLLDNNFQIPPMAMNYTPPGYPAAFPSIGGAKIWGVLPHMHTKGKRIRMDYDSTCLVDIPKWDFHWQQGYYFNQPVVTTASIDKMKLSCTWDNPTNQTVTWGESTSDEMCLGYVYFTQ